MEEKKHHHHHPTGPEPKHPSDGAIPYWMRAHRDWRFWAALIFISLAIVVYILSVDLSLAPKQPFSPFN